MPHSNISRAPRQHLTERVLQAKTAKNLTWVGLAEGTGLSVVYVTAALLGQHPLPEAVAEVVAERLGLDRDAVAELQTIRCAAMSKTSPVTRPSTASMKWFRSTAQR